MLQSERGLGSHFGAEARIIVKNGSSGERKSEREREREREDVWQPRGELLISGGHKASGHER